MNHRRLLQTLTLFVCVLLPLTASAANYDYKILIDADNSASTGCSAFTMSGLEWVITTSVVTDDSGARVTGVTRQSCESGALGAAVPLETQGWPASWNPNSGMLDVETRLRFSDLGVSSMPFGMRLGFLVISGTATDLVIVDNNTDIIWPPQPIRRRALGGPVPVDVNGDLREWIGFTPLVEGISPNGAPVLRFINIFAGGDADEFFFAFSSQSHRNAPTAVNDTYTVPASQPSLVVNPPGVLGNDVDPRGLQLRAILVTDVQHGTLTLNENGSFSYTPNGSANVDFFRYKASNGEQESNPARVELIPEGAPQPSQNRAPQAVPDQYGIVGHGGMITINAPGVLGNDIDQDGDTLTAVLVDNVDHGTLTLNGNGGFQYRHDGSNTLTDSFTYRAFDGTAFSNTVTVQLTIGPNAPPTGNPDSFTVNEGGTVSGNVLTNDTDPDTPASSMRAQLVTGPAHASSFVLNNNGTFTYTHNGSETTSDSFTYRATDGILSSAITTVTITITPVNDPPVVQGETYNTLEDQPLTVPPPGVLSNDSDPDNPTLTAALVTNGTKGNVVLAANGGFTYTPNANENGTDTFTYSVTDGNTTLNAVATINITPVNDVPSFTAGPNIVVDSNAGAQTIDPWATAISEGPANESAQSVVFEITNNDNSGLFSVQPSVSPTGVLTFTPVPGSTGTANITLRIRDDGGTANGGVDTSATQTFSINVDSVPFVASTTPAASAVVATNSTVTVNFSEPVNVAGTWFQIVCGTSGTHTPANSNVTGGPQNYVIDPNTDFTQGESCTMTIFAAQVSDVDPIDPPNNMAANHVVNFSVDAQPSVTATTPANGATGVISNSNLSVTFSEPVNTNGSSFALNCTMSGAVALAVSGGPATFTLDPATDLAPGETCTLTVSAANVGDQDSIDPPDTMAADVIVSFTVDAAPSVVTTTPANGSADSQPNTDVTITFSEPVDVTGNWFSIVCTISGTRDTSNSVVTGGPTTFTINPNVDFTPGETCNATVFAANVDDQDANDPPANMLANYNFTFLFDQAPTVTATTPANGATDIATNANIDLTFSEPVTLTGSWFTISCATSGAHTATVSGGAVTYQLNPDSDFAPNEVCTVTVLASQVSDNDANDPPDTMAADYVFSFTTDAAPSVTTTTPANGATNQAANTDVTINFSESVNVTATFATINCTVSGAHTYTTSGSGASRTINPDTDFTQGETCTVTVLASDVADADANDPPDTMLGNHVFSFSIDAAPSVTATTPANGATQVGTDDDIVLTFSEDVTITNSSVTISCASSGAHTVAVSGGPINWTVNPDVDFAQGELCTVTVLANQVDDNDANDPPDDMLANHVFSFTTDVEPTVTATTPVNGGGASPAANISVTFSEPVDVTGSWFTINCTTSGAHTASVSGGPTTFTLDPNTDFTGGETCTVTIVAANVNDQDLGDPPSNLPADYVFNFAVDAAPTVTNTIPANGATDIATNADIQVDFSEIVNYTTASFTINCATSGSHSFALSAGPAAGATLNPDVDFAPNELCTVTVVAANVTDNDAIDPPDNMAADYVFSFTTDAAPAVTTTTPANGATDQAGNTDITVNFTESVNVTATFATINCTVSGAHTYTTSGSGASRTINPDTDFTQGETCTVTILASDVADADANDPPDTMVGNHVFSFSIDAAPSVTATTPANGATQIATNTNISLTFSEAVTITNASVTITCGTSGAHTVAVSGGPTIWTVNPDLDFAPNETCTVTVLAAGVADNDGNDPPDNMTANHVFSFTTDQAPSVTATTPTNGGGTSPSGNISVTFSEPVDATGSSFTINCTVSGAHTFVLGGNPTTYTLDPNSDFTGGETCTVTVIAAQIDDQDLGDPPANMLADHVFSFLVDAAPTVTTTTPNNGDTGVATNANVVINFSEMVVAGGSSFTINCATSGAHAFTPSASPSASYTLDPTVDFAPNELCTVTVVGANVSDSDLIDPPDTMAADYVFSFTTDAAPFVTTTTPANGATDIAGNTNVDINFSEAVTFAGGSFTINCTVSGAHTFALSGTSTSATLNPDTDFTAGETCTVTVLAAGVTDNDANDPPNNMLANHVFSFTIDQAPSVTNTIPANGSTTATTNTNLTIDFSESVTLGSVTVNCATSGAHTNVVSASPASSFTVNPDTDFAPGELCTVTVPAAQVTDTDANDPPNNMLADHVFTFTTDQAPSVTATTPTNGGIAAPDTNLTITFSEPVDVTGSWFTITCGTTGTHTAVVSGGPTTYTLNPDTDFTGGETCNVSILAANVTDQDGNDPPDNMLANHNFSFTVDGAPVVVSTSPTNGAVDSATNVNVVITYDEPVTAGGTAYSIECPTGSAQAFVLSGNGTAVHTLDPNVNLPAGVTCTVTILAAQIADVDANDPPDNMAANYIFSFSTDAAPSVTSTTPTNGATGVTSNADVTVNFSESVTLSAVGISCTVSGAHTNVISASPSSTFTVNPDTDFSPGETCTVTILSTSVTDTDGNDPPDNMTANHVFSFTIDQQPSVTATTPTNGAVNQATNVNIVITFSEPVTAPDAAFTINCGGAQAFTGSGSGTNTVTLDPTADLPAGTSCTVTVLAASIQDVDSNDPPDNMAANHVFSFTTDAAPSVTTTTPANGATDIAKTSNITINFSENVDVTASTFEIKCPSSGPVIGFAFVGGTTGVNTVTLNPNTDLVSGELCQVTVFANQVADSDANDPPNNMAADHVFSFGVEPDAIDDTHPHTHVGNVQSNSATFFKVTTNDLSANAFTITAFDATTVNGGQIVMQTSGANMGEFTYNPPPGFEGTDSFTYTISNVHGTDTATVQINVSGMVWFIDQNDGVGPFDGRLGSPFQTLAQFEAVNGNADVGNARNPQANDNIFLYQSGTAYVGPVTLENAQKLIGQDSATAAFGAGSITGLTAAPSQAALPGVNSGDGVFVSITSATNGVVLAQNNQVRGLRFGTNSTMAIAGTNFGTLFVRDALVNNANGGGFNLNTGTMDVILASFSTTNGTHGLNLTSVGGSFSAPAGTINTPNTAGISVTGSNPTITHSGSITTSGRPALLTSNLTGGSYTLGTINVGGTGAGNDGVTLDGTGAAVDLTIANATINTANMDDGVTLSDLGSGSDVTFSAGSITSTGSTRRVIEFIGTTNCNCNFATITLSGNSSDGLALGAGQLGTYQFGPTTINTPNGGTAVTVVGDANSLNTDSSVTFRSINVATCSGKGIDVNNHSGSFTVLGTGAANSGGTISGCTQHGGRFGISTSANTGAKNITLTDMTFSGNGTANLGTAAACGDLINGTNTNCAAAIDLQQVDTVSLTRVVMSGSAQNGLNARNVTALTLNDVDVTGNGNEANENGINIHNLFGTMTWTTVDATNNAGSQMEIQNASGTNNLTVNNSTFTNTVWPGSLTSSHGVLFSGTGASTSMTLSLQNASIARNFGPAFQADSGTGADLNVTVNGGSMIDNGQHFVIASTGAGDITYALTNITQMWVDEAHTGVTPISIARGDGASGNFLGVIQGNTIGQAGDANSGAPCTGCNIISVRNNGSSGGFNRITIGGSLAGQGNTLQRSAGGGINVTAGLNVSPDSGNMHVKIIGNTLTGPDNPTATALPITIVNGTTAGDTSQTCANVLNNTIQNTGGTGSWNLSAVIRLRHPVNNTIYRLPGYTGALTDTAAVETYLEGRNTLPGGSNAAVQYGGAAGGGYSNTSPAGSDCF